MLDVDGNIRSGGQLSGATARINYIAGNTQNLQFTSGSANSTVVATMFTGSGNWVYQAAQNATDLGYKIAINSSGISGSLYVSGSSNFNGNTTVTGSLNISAGITGSLQGTSSWATNSITASYALTSAGGSGGISQGKVVAIATGYANLF